MHSCLIPRLTPSLERPIVVYLIKPKHKGNLDSPVRGFDVYEVRQGQRITKNDPTLTYRVGEDDDVTIEVDPVDTGLVPEGVAPAPAPLTISLAEMRFVLERYGVVFESENQE